MKDKFSILIPTLFHSDMLTDLCSAFAKHELVEEVIVLDNTGESTHRFPDKKLIIIPGKKENYVNASWNQLVDFSRAEFYALLNDDILIDPNILFEILDHDWSIPSIIGLDYDTIVTKKNLQKPEVVPMIDKYESMPFGWGQALFGKKSQWPVIPEYLKIWCGDNYLCNKLNPYILQNVFWEGKTETTSGRTEFKEIKENDIRRWQIMCEKGLI